MELVVPFNTKARITIDQEETNSLQINGMKFQEFQKNNNTEIRNKSELVLGSGEYQIGH